MVSAKCCKQWQGTDFLEEDQCLLKKKSVLSRSIKIQPSPVLISKYTEKAEIQKTVSP